MYTGGLQTLLLDRSKTDFGGAIPKEPGLAWRTRFTIRPGWERYALDSTKTKWPTPLTKNGTP